MRAIIFATVIAIVSWMIFVSMNELTSANNVGGCCGNGNCGVSTAARLNWWANLIIGIVATVAALYEGARMYLGRGKPIGAFLA